MATSSQVKNKRQQVPPPQKKKQKTNPGNPFQSLLFPLMVTIPRIPTQQIHFAGF